MITNNKVGNSFNHLKNFEDFVLLSLLNFNKKNNTKSSKFYRWLNEFPTLLLIIIVLVVVFKPM